MASRTARRRARVAVPGTTGDLFAPCVPPVAAPRPAPAAPLPVRPPSRQLWLALRLPRLALVAAARGRPAELPFAVIREEAGRRTVLAASDTARAAGVRAGQPLSVAAALAPALEAVPYDPQAEADALEAVARWALGFTPVVSLEPPDELLLEVRGSLALFGGPEALIARVAGGLQAAGHAGTSALAPTPRAALWLARAAAGGRVLTPADLAGALATVPLAATGWTLPVLEDCARLGVTTLGELRRLPRDGLARRFSPALLAELDEAYGRRPSPRRRHLTPERFHERLELPAEARGSPELEPYCDHLLQALAATLQRRAAGVTRLAFLLGHRGRPPTCLTVGRALPSGEAAEWRLLVRERLARVVLPAPALTLTLRSGAVVPLTGPGRSLPGIGPGDTEGFALVDRLRARLGEAAVCGLCLVPEHRPEEAFRTVRPGAAAAAPEAAALPLAPRPLWLLEAPAPLALRAGRPWHDGPLTLQSGPERIESGWWDGQGVARDYYVARTARGARLWLFREHGSRAWYLHGVFG